jgi:hypothetical protein
VDFEEQRLFLEDEHKASSSSAIETLTTANSKEVVKLKKLIQDLESALMLEKTKTEGTQKKNFYNSLPHSFAVDTETFLTDRKSFICLCSTVSFVVDLTVYN